MPTRKQRGYDSQRIVADRIRAAGFVHAESAGAGRSGTDITGTPGIDWEVAARRGLVLADKMRQQAKRADGQLGVVVLRMDGQGPASIDDWPAVVRLADLLDLLATHPDHDPRLLINHPGLCGHDLTDPANVLLTGGCRPCHMDRLRRDSLR